MYLFRNNVDKRFAVAVESMCSSFSQSNMTTSSTFYGAYVNSFSIGLRRTGTTGYIAGIEEFDALSGNETQYSSKLTVIFSELKTALGKLPGLGSLATKAWNAIAATYSPPTTTVARGTNHYCLTVDHLGTYNELQLDDAPIPVFFQLNSGSTGTFTGTAYVNIEYVIDTEYAAFYVPTEDATRSVSMSVG